MDPITIIILALSIIAIVVVGVIVARVLKRRKDLSHSLRDLGRELDDEAHGIANKFKRRKDQQSRGGGSGDDGGG